MKNILERLVVIGSIAFATAGGSDLTNQPYVSTKLAGYNVQVPTNASPTLLRFIDQINQQKLGHATNVIQYNSQTEKSEKRQVWEVPVKINGYVVGYGGDSNSVPIIFKIPVHHPLGLEQNLSVRKYLMSPTPRSNSDSNSVPAILEALPPHSYQVLSNDTASKVRGSTNPKAK